VADPLFGDAGGLWKYSGEDGGVSLGDAAGVSSCSSSSPDASKAPSSTAGWGNAAGNLAGASGGRFPTAPEFKMLIIASAPAAMISAALESDKFASRNVT